MKQKQSRIKLQGPGSPNLSINLAWILGAILTMVAALAIVFGARAIETFGQSEGGALRRVPDDYATIQAAIDASRPGDIVQVEAGIYNENITLDKPVSLIAESFDQINPANNRTVIDGGNRGVTILIPSGLTQMPTVRGFVIQNGVDNIQASSAFVAEYNFIHSANNLVSYQMGGGGPNRGNIYFNARDNAIRLDNMDRHVLIEANRILYSANSGIEISLQSATAPGAIVEIDIWSNMILGNGEDGIQFVDHPENPQDTNRRFVIAGNLLANNQKAGIGLMANANTLEDFSGADVIEAVRVFNNTFYDNNYGISGGDNLVAFNNIFASSPSRGTWRVQGGNSVVAYSLFHNNGIDTDETSVGTGVILDVDPRFEAAPNPGPDGAWGTVDDDYSGLVLRSDSPAIDKGVTQFRTANGEFVPPSPLTGYAGAAPDLGWREVGAPIFMTATATPISSFTPSPTGTLETVTPTTTVTLTPELLTATPVSPTPLASATSTLATPSPITSPTSSTATTTPQITIQEIVPDSAQANTTITVAVTGSGFQDGATVLFEGGSGLSQEVLQVQVVNSTTIMVTLNARNDGTAGPQVWDVRVTNPDGSTTVLPDAFTVFPAP